MVDITGLDKAAVLAALFNGARPQGMGFLHYNPAPMTIQQAREIIDRISSAGSRLYFDYLQGRVIKTGIDNDAFDPWLYDRDNGEGAAEIVIRSLRAQPEDPNAEAIERLHVHGVAAALDHLLNSETS